MLVSVVAQTCLVIVHAYEQGQHFVACMDGDQAWLYLNCGVRGGHWYIRPVIPGSCALQMLPKNTEVLEQKAAT